MKNYDQDLANAQFAYLARHADDGTTGLIIGIVLILVAVAGYLLWTFLKH